MSILKDLLRSAPLAHPLWMATPVRLDDYVEASSYEISWCEKDLAAPPFENAFYEWRFLDEGNRRCGMGVHVKTRRPDLRHALPPGRYTPAGLDADYGLEIVTSHGPFSHGLEVAVFDRIGRAGFETRAFVLVKEGGSFLTVGEVCDRDCAYPMIFADGKPEFWRIRPKDREGISGRAMWGAVVVQSAHNHLNARNVGLVRRDDGQLGKGKQSGKYRGIVWHEIVVTKKPLTEAASKVVSREDVDHVLKREHLARGHFKDYTKGRGLFGKFQGRFWWSPHVRGSRDEGSVKKGYRLESESPAP